MVNNKSLECICLFHHPSSNYFNILGERRGENLLLSSFFNRNKHNLKKILGAELLVYVNKPAMNFKAIINFKEIKTNAYVKERERKLEDQEKFEKCFNRIVGSYFESHNFEYYHKEFNSIDDRLDCFVPSRGEFKCQQFSIPGTKLTSENLGVVEGETKLVWRTDEKTGKKTQEEVVIYPKNGCGKNWKSNKCLTKFVCSIEEGNKLEVMLREYGQICGRCERRYENPSFEEHVREIMMVWLLSMILEGKLFIDYI